MRKIVLLLLLALPLAVHVRAQTAAAPSAKTVDAAKALLEASGLEGQMSVMYANMINAMGAGIAPEKREGFKKVTLNFLSKYMSYESLKQDLALVYAAEFSADELKAITAFYLTPAGKKLNSKMSVLQQRGITIAQQKLQEHAVELQQDIEKEIGKQ
jgi:uncharacterized protein